MEPHSPSLKIQQRTLPHWTLDGSIYFITFNTWEKLELNAPAQQIVFDACLFFHQQRYKLYTFVVMPDHVHLLLQPLPKTELAFWSLSEILHSIKSYTSRQVPKVMQHMGTVWQPERYDRIIRDRQEFETYWNYIYQNPVKAGLAAKPEIYAYFWCVCS
ncbi:REP-associated tyrosine transposase [Prochlorothrix hollandica]|uniref:Transposase n=1 Tax=Prochlorothrix hollandica PCC 9006 = CALU 1027 TaxID=317619 RepID=A0A0M2PTP4_PROHO|nr:transposase [Prochlorothrix hollandica]KKI99865.1 transposase [Prochlorothrix hollandica PCC 9006 = CALU 1027]